MSKTFIRYNAFKRIKKQNSKRISEDYQTKKTDFLKQVEELQKQYTDHLNRLNEEYETKYKDAEDQCTQKITQLKFKLPNIEKRNRT